MPDLHETIMGRKFFAGDFPALVKNVERVAAALEVQNKAAEEKANPKEKVFPASQRFSKKERAKADEILRDDHA